MEHSLSTIIKGQLHFCVGPAVMGPPFVPALDYLAQLVAEDPKTSAAGPPATSPGATPGLAHRGGFWGGIDDCAEVSSCCSAGGG